MPAAATGHSLQQSIAHGLGGNPGGHHQSSAPWQPLVPAGTGQDNQWALPPPAEQPGFVTVEAYIQSLAKSEPALTHWPHADASTPQIEYDESGWPMRPLGEVEEPQGLPDSHLSWNPTGWNPDAPLAAPAGFNTPTMQWQGHSAYAQSGMFDPATAWNANDPMAFGIQSGGVPTLGGDALKWSGEPAAPDSPPVVVPSGYFGTVPMAPMKRTADQSFFEKASKSPPPTLAPRLPKLAPAPMNRAFAVTSTRRADVATAATPKPGPIPQRRPMQVKPKGTKEQLELKQLFLVREFKATEAGSNGDAVWIQIPHTTRDEQRAMVTAALLLVPRRGKNSKDAHGSKLSHLKALRMHNPELQFWVLCEVLGLDTAVVEDDVQLLPPPLEPAQKQALAAALVLAPRFDDNGKEIHKSKILHARKLRELDPELGFIALAIGSGCTLRQIERDPVINPATLTDEDRALMMATMLALPFTNEAGEPNYKSSLAYARHLHERAPTLTLAALSIASGLPLSDIKNDPKLNSPTLTPEQQTLLEKALESIFRFDDDRIDQYGSDLGHARALKEAFPGLELLALSKGSGASVTNLRRDPKTYPPAVGLAQQSLLNEALVARPRFVKGVDQHKSDIGHARALKAFAPGLKTPALSKGSGANAQFIDADMQINPPALDPQQQALLDIALLAVPRLDPSGNDTHGSALQHGLALSEHTPTLKIDALGKGCTADLGKLKKMFAARAAAEREGKPPPKIARNVAHPNPPKRNQKQKRRKPAIVKPPTT